MESAKSRYIRRFIRSFFITLSIGAVIVLAAGAAVGVGMIKDIIDQAPPISLAGIRPSDFATRIYDSQGNLTETLVALAQQLGYTEGEAYTLLYSGGLEIYTTQDPQCYGRFLFYYARTL